jgi:sigma-E factor negative regulatory protein RseC
LLSSKTSCVGCQAQNACHASGEALKEIVIPGSHNLNPGDKVVVSVTQSMGFLALFISYVLPLFLVIFMLVLLSAFSVNELKAGLISLVILIPYYSLVFLFRKTIDSKFSFSIKA